MTPASATVAVTVAALSAAPALAGRDVSIYPAAQCAAFWFGFYDYAKHATGLNPNPQDQHRAEAFRQIAYRLNTSSPAEIDAFIAEQRPLMVALMDAVIYDSDGPGRDLFERLTETCEDFGQMHPETRKLS